MTIVYMVTKNNVKRRAAKKVFKKYNINLLQVKKNYPEIQADSSLEIARFTAFSVAKSLNTPVIREDHSLYINSLGIPGPYTAFIDKKLSVNRLLKILSLFKDRNGFFEISTVYAEPNGKSFEYTYKVPIEFSKIMKGHSKYGWNSIIHFRGCSKSFAEVGEVALSENFNKNFVHIAKNITKFKRADTAKS